MSLQTKILIIQKQVLFERIMFPKYNGFYLTGLFKVLCEIWHFYYMKSLNVTAKKNGAKVAHCISTCKYCSENSSFGLSSLNIGE